MTGNYYQINIWNNDGTFTMRGEKYTREEAIALAQEWKKKGHRAEIHHFIIEKVDFE